jgi:AcrR family transcriptional regulator
VKPTGPDPIAPRVPVQLRAQARCDAVLVEARALLAETGLSGFSIPVLAERLRFPRASIYNFFPTPQAILNELARSGLMELEQWLGRQFLRQPTQNWRDQIRRSIEVVTDFYTQRPVDRLLILGSSASDETYRAVLLTCQHLGETTRRFFEAAGVVIPRTPIDVLPLAVDLGTTGLRHAVLAHDRITPEYQEAAVQTMVRVLEPYVTTHESAR